MADILFTPDASIPINTLRKSKIRRTSISARQPASAPAVSVQLYNIIILTLWRLWDTFRGFGLNRTRQYICLYS